MKLSNSYLHVHQCSNLQNYWVVAHPDYLYPLVCYIFSESMVCLKLYTETFLYMSLYLSTCAYKWAGMHTLVYKYTPQFRILTDTWFVALITFFSVNIIFLSSPHLWNVSRMGSHHIQHLGLRGDPLVKIVSPWETHDSGFCLNGLSVNRSKYCLSTHNWKLLIHLYSCNSI